MSVKEIALSVLRKANLYKPVLYHYTSYHSLLNIFKTRELFLTPANGSDLVQGKKHGFYLSTARTPINKFNSHTQVNLVMSRDWIGQRASIEALDYWGPSYRQHNRGATETEDRVFSNNPELKLPEKLNQAIMEIHIWLRSDLEARWVSNIRKIVIQAKKFKIGVYVYTDTKAYTIMDVRKALTNVELVAALSIQDKEINKPYVSTRKPGEGLKELIQAKNRSQLTREGKRELERLLRPSWENTKINMETRIYFEAEVHNNKKERSFLSVNKVIVQRGGLVPFLEWLYDKWSEK